MTARILVIDDESSVLLFLRALLQRKGHSVTVCETAEAALEAARHDVFDLVISDKNLPDLNGMDLIGLIRQLQPSVPAILMTAFPEVVKSAVRIQGYLPKPFDNLEQVLDAVERALAFGVLMRHSAPAAAAAK